jgi:penicillin-binding protein 1C
VHRLTLDAQGAGNLEQLVREHAASMGGRLSAALLVVDHQTGGDRPVDRPATWTTSRFGAVDMTDAVRSPGSTSNR